MLLALHFKLRLNKPLVPPLLTLPVVDTVIDETANIQLKNTF